MWVDNFCPNGVLYSCPKYATKGRDDMNANKIRARIKEKGMNQGEVAKLMGISQNSLSRKLLGQREFSLSEVVSLCNILEFDDAQNIFLT